MKSLYYIIFLSFFTCKKETKKITQKNPNIQGVIILGTSDNIDFNKSISFHDDSNLYEGQYKDLKKEFYGDTLLITLEKITNTKLLEFNSFCKKKYYRTRIIISPGDTISYSLKNEKLMFSGKNSAHYNFYLEMDKNYDEWTKIYLNKYNPDFKKYKKQCDSLYHKRLSFFKKYIKKHPSVSEEFKKIIKNDLRFEYLVNILRPRSEKESSWTVNTSEDIMNIYERGNKQEGKFFNLNDYLNNITVKEINKPEYANFLYFQMSIIPLLRQYLVKSSEIPYSINSFKEETKFLKENFNQKIIDYAMAKLIIEYFNNGFGKDDKTTKFMQKTIKEYKESINDFNIVNLMVDIENELKTINKKIPKELDELVLNLTKDTINIRPIMQQKKTKVICFWASWCQPCIKEIILSKHIRESICSEYDVDFIYMSIDKNSKKWIDQSFDLYEFFLSHKQFKILNHRNSKLINSLNIKTSFGLSIPRYVILDSNNIIIDNNAPKPSLKKFEEIIKTLK